MKQKEYKCQVCLHEYDKGEEKITGMCPFCMTRLQPMKVSESGYIRINWQQIRVLAIYSRRWAAGFDTEKRGNRDALQALENIIAHLRQFRPKDGEPLTIEPLLEPQTKEMDLTPDASGQIPSPFFKKGRL